MLHNDENKQSVKKESDLIKEFGAGGDMDLLYFKKLIN